MVILRQKHDRSQVHLEFPLHVYMDVGESGQTSRIRMSVLLMDRLSLCRYAPLNHTVRSVV